MKEIVDRVDKNVGEVISDTAFEIASFLKEGGEKTYCLNSLIGEIVQREQVGKDIVKKAFNHLVEEGSISIEGNTVFIYS